MVSKGIRSHLNRIYLYKGIRQDRMNKKISNKCQLILMSKKKFFLLLRRESERKKERMVNLCYGYDHHNDFFTSPTRCEKKTPSFDQILVETV